MLDRSINLLCKALPFFALTALTSVAARAAEGKPENWQLGFQDAATDIAQQIHDFHDLLLVIITAIVVFVLGLLIWVMIRYNAKANPTPSKTSHNTTVEIVWTIVPVLILLVIAVPSFRLLYAQYDVPKADITIKATGYQWYWSYEYPDNGGFGFDSILVEKDELKAGQPYLLTVDNEVVVPVNKVVHVLLTSNDVIHDWAIPSFGVKLDAVKGRNSLVWFKVNKPGVYYGQCSELCGARHAFMPITVRAVPEEEFQAWVENAQQAFASTMPERPKLAGPASGQQDDRKQTLASAELKLTERR
ncbi:MAG TPA: cytochrome c oxidase subunit II [Hyphomicrobiales bacterium]|nr:cytochrome c oxidase subunit II [Hyphomicrobiales bacterium]